MRLTTLAKVAWGVLLLNIGVVLWGAYVRATGSGAGCGQHWPTCNGEVIPRAPVWETMVEFTHRLTSGLAFLAVLGLLIWVLRTCTTPHPARGGAIWAMIFMVIEALVGAGLVLFEMVAYNPSMARVIWVSAHLLNTFLLLGALALTAWWLSGGGTVRFNRQGKVVWLFALGGLGIMVLGVSGAITALGDTLFPAESLAAGIAHDFDAAAHFLVRLRVWHPVLAVGIGLYLVIVGGIFGDMRYGLVTRRLARGLIGLFFAQLVVGVLNLVLLVPVVLQLTHLFLADSLWLILVLLGASALSEPVSEGVALQNSNMAGSQEMKTNQLTIGD